MKFLRLLGLFCIIFCMLMTACYYDNQESLYPVVSSSCDTSNVAYSGSIKPMLSQHCLGCHSNATASSAKNIKLEDYPDVVINADKSLQAIRWDQVAGIVAMPYLTGSKLDNCQITLFTIWIRKGKLNN